MASDHPCDPLREAVGFLRSEIQRLQDSIPGLEEAGINTDPVRFEIRQLERQLWAENQAYLKCLAQQQAPPPRSNLAIAGVERTQAIYHLSFYDIRAMNENAAVSLETPGDEYAGMTTVASK